MLRKILFTLAAGAVCSFSSYADDIEYCYSDRTIEPEWYGTGVSDTYDVAIRITDEGMVGSKVKGIKVPFPEGGGIENAKGWLSTELKLENKANVADIATAEMTYVDGSLVCTFETPYEIPAEGVYVGYSFTIPDVKANTVLRKPIAVSSSKTVKDGLWIHTLKQYRKWKNQGEAESLATYITAVIEGDFGDVSTGISIPGELYYKADEPGSVNIPVTLVARGKVSLSELGYKYEVTSAGGEKFEGEGVRKFETPVDVQFGHSYTTNLPIPEVSFPKEIYSGTLTLVSVNGTENTDAQKTTPLKFETLTIVPVHKPVMEEYTGLWCGWCPKGFASLAHMNKKYPGHFIGISYHNNDDMMVIAPESFPSRVTGFPAAWMDREISLDCFSGTSGEGFGFEQDWLARREKFTPIAVNCIAYFDASDSDLIHVESEVTNVRDINMLYKTVYVLLADGLTKPNWAQANNYGGNIGYDVIPEMEPFISTSSSVRGLVYDDIYVASSPIKGLDESLPYPMVADQTYEGTYEFRPSEVKNLYGMEVIQDKKKLRVVTLVVDSFGYIVNANVCRVCDSKEESLTGVEGVAADAEVVSEEWYSLNGMRVANPEGGIFIRVSVMGDGSRKVQKIVK